jgi:hypothetical protein
VQVNLSNKKADHFSSQRKRRNDKKGSWNKTLCSYCGKSGKHIEKCWTLYLHLCLKKNRKDVKTLARRQEATLDEVNGLTEKIAKEYFLMVGLGKVIYEEIKEWFMDNGSSLHMTRMRSIFLTFLESDTDYYVESGTNKKQAIRGYVYIIFQLESGGFMGIKHMLYVPNLKLNLLSVATFEDEGYAVAFQNDQVLVYSTEDAPDTTIVLGIHKERLYRLLVRPIVWSNGFLDLASDSMSDSVLASEALSEVKRCETPLSTMG